MPKRDRKMTLRERADKYAARWEGEQRRQLVRTGYIAGEIARGKVDRVTKVERQMIAGVLRWFNKSPPPLPSRLFFQIVRVKDERAKGRK